MSPSKRSPSKSPKGSGISPIGKAFISILVITVVFTIIGIVLLTSMPAVVPYENNINDDDIKNAAKNAYLMLVFSLIFLYTSSVTGFIAFILGIVWLVQALSKK
jgi:hypothetical protein